MLPKLRDLENPTAKVICYKDPTGNGFCRQPLAPRRVVNDQPSDVTAMSQSNRLIPSKAWKYHGNLT